MGKTSKVPELPETAIVVSKKPRGGRVPGVRVPASPATIAANRVKSWKHGKYARTVSMIEGRAAKLAEKDPEIVDLIECYVEAIDSGDIGSTNGVAALGMAEREQRRRQVADSISEKGVLIEEALYDKDGNAIGTRFKANPLLEHEAAIARDLGHTAEAMQLTKKSRGEGAKDQAMTAYLKRDEFLRGSNAKDAMPPPPDDEP